jgi:uncharacterized protein (DUF58 family)
MIPTQILRKIRRIQITTSKKATELFAGEYRSVFKGRGMEFEEVREYLPGDEIRSIDWNVTARMGRPFIKKMVEERELTIMLLLDVSRSSCFGSVNALKRDMAAEVCAVLAAAAAKNNDKVGLIIFTDQVECFVPPRKGTKHIFKVIREALYFKPRGVGTDIGRCLKYLEMVTTKRAVVFVISDFYAEGIKKPLSVSSRRHDLIAVNILDPRDTDIPDAGMIELEDAETGRRHLVDSSLRSFRDNYRNIALKKQEERKRFFYSLGIDRIEISTAKPYEEALIRFFGSRKTRK